MGTDLSLPWAYPDQTGHWTRNPVPAGWPGGRAPVFPVLGFSPAQLRTYIAVHEAGHAVIAAVQPMYATDGWGPLNLSRVYVSPHEMEGRPLSGSGLAQLGPADNLDYYDYAVYCAAGERAADRWLCEEGLWTPARGWVAEASAFGDRYGASVIDPRWRVAYTGAERAQCEKDKVTAVDYTEAQREADEALDELWPYVLRVTRLLFTHAHLTGDQVRAVVADHVPSEED